MDSWIADMVEDNYNGDNWIEQDKASFLMEFVGYLKTRLGDSQEEDDWKILFAVSINHSICNTITIWYSS